MKTIGLIGGMSWESTVPIPLINRGINQKLGGNHSAKCILYSFAFGDPGICSTPGTGSFFGKKNDGCGSRAEEGGAIYCALYQHDAQGHEQFEADAGDTPASHC